MLTKHKFQNMLLLLLTLIVTLIYFRDALTSALFIWQVSEIFNHCFLIIPISCFLIYRQRRRLIATEIKPAPIVFFPLTALVLLSIFANIGDINIFRHIAVFSFIPIAIVSFIGFKAAKVIIFPLSYMLLAIPIGEELIPTLQSITADMAVWMLEMVNIPIYRSGLYIDIPGGKFLVAEACSGVSFLISSIAFGSLYAHLNFQTFKAKFGFSLLSILVPILANSVRVFGIIVIAHTTNMEYAVGADHLIYGWVFYLFVLFCLFYLGEYLSKNSQVKTTLYTNHRSWGQYNALKPSIFILLLLCVAFIWNQQITKLKDKTVWATLASSIQWQKVEADKLGTIFNSADKQLTAQFYIEELAVVVNIGIYQPQSKGETVSSKSQVYNNKQWNKFEDKFSVDLLLTSDDRINIPVTVYVSPTGAKKAVMQWFILGDKIIANEVLMKLTQTYKTMLNSHQFSANVVVSADINSEQTLSQVIKRFTKVPLQLVEVVSK